MTNDRGIVANSLPDIDRGTDARAKMSRRRFLAFTMVGIMIVAAITMVMPAILEKGVGNGDNSVPASIERFGPNARGLREAVYTINHLFENYIKLDNNTYANHKQSMYVKEAYLGHHGNVMGVCEWLNTSSGTSPRVQWSEMMLRNNYPYVGYWQPAATGVGSGPSSIPNPTRNPGLATWAPYRLTGVIKNDTYLRTGNSVATRQMPFSPIMNLSATTMVNGGKVNVSLYGSYMSSAELENLSAGTHFGNWFYGLPSGVNGVTSDGYLFELHGTIIFNKSALQTFLNYTPGVASVEDLPNKAPTRIALDSTNPITWFNTEIGNIRANFRNWMWENFSQPIMAPYWDATQNANIFTCTEFDMIGDGELNVAIKLDPCNTVGAWNYSGNFGAQDARGQKECQLAIRVYYEGWGTDTAIKRMMEAANLTGSSAHVGTGMWTNRASLGSYMEDIYVNTTITRSSSNSSFRGVCTNDMLGWEDDSDGVWSSGWQLDLGRAIDYEPNAFGAQDSYPSPMNKYRLNGVAASDTALDAVTWGGTGTKEKTKFWNSPGSNLFHTNATVCEGAPMVRNLSGYEAIVINMNLNARASGQAWALQPYSSALQAAGVAKDGEYGRWSYWGTLKLGQGCFPQAQILAGYDTATKILNLSGGVAGLTIPLTYNTDWWGGRTGQPNRILCRGAPIIQFDVAAVDHYTVALQNATTTMSKPEKVIVTPLNKTNQIPVNGAGKRFLNCSVQLSYNKDIKIAVPTWSGNGSLLTFNNVTNPGTGRAFTRITFNAVDANAYINATDVQFAFLVGAGLQNQTGSLGPFAVGAIPEFTTVLVPIVGMMAMFFVFRTIKRKREE